MKPQAHENVVIDELKKIIPTNALGDIVDNKIDYKNINDQMKNELVALDINERILSTQLPDIQEIESPLKSTALKTFTVLSIDENTENKEKTPLIRNLSKQNSLDSNQKTCKTIDIKTFTHPLESDNSSTENKENCEKQQLLLIVDNTKPIHDIVIEKIKTVEYLKPIQSISHDTPSSDLSDTDLSEKQEKILFNESGVDESSRDERDEASEIENFDLSSCGEDSLEAMYYMLRKNEIVMDKNKLIKPATTIKCEEEKIAFPEKATENLENVFREVSGKKTMTCSNGSMNSSVDDVVLKQISSDSDGLQLHVIQNSEIESCSEQKICSMNRDSHCSATDTTDDEYLNPIIYSVEKNENSLNEMQTVEQQNANDLTLSDYKTDELELDDMVVGNIERKILASSLSEADSDYMPIATTAPNAKRLTKDDFNVSTAFEHMMRTESTDESDSTYESAATKIQAGARGFLTRRRLQKSSTTGTSADKYSSIGNAAIDNSLDYFAEQHELLSETNESETSTLKRLLQTEDTFNLETMESIDESNTNIQGITEITFEQRKEHSIGESTSIIIDESYEDTLIMSPENNESGSETALRRLTLQRGIAMQRNSTPESEQQPNEKRKTNQEVNNKTELSKTGNNRVDQKPNKSKNHGSYLLISITKK